MWTAQKAALSRARVASFRESIAPDSTSTLSEFYALLEDATDEIERLERELARVRLERDEFIVQGAVAGTVRMGPDTEDSPIRRRR